MAPLLASRTRVAPGSSLVHLLTDRIALNGHSEGAVVAAAVVVVVAVAPSLA